eukprot:TRINITY_DN664_c0_g1_i1.p1 TRINITY_DN664_c0_g1~~TRINITY_DN664_c0_g1_i1.p1  ORF type:complete len:317 (-),score=101.30 TRINITY_DN664_c0_g1_i1:204-1154(-)
MSYQQLDPNAIKKDALRFHAREAKQAVPLRVAGQATAETTGSSSTSSFSSTSTALSSTGRRLHAQDRVVTSGRGFSVRNMRIEKGATKNELVYEFVERLKVLDGEPATALQLTHAVGLDGFSSDQVLELLKDNPAVDVQEGVDVATFSFKTKHGIRSREDLKRLLLSHEDGVDVKELRSSYNELAADIEYLVNAGVIYKVYNPNERTDILFLNNAGRADAKSIAQLKVDKECKDLWAGVREKMPTSVSDLHRELKRRKLTVLTRDKVAAAGLGGIDVAIKKQTGKKQRKRNIGKVTNEHLGKDWFKDEVGEEAERQ